MCRRIKNRLTIVVRLFLIIVLSKLNLSAEKEPVKNTKLNQEKFGSLAFEENKGQLKPEKFAPKILFRAEFSGVDIYITEQGLTYYFESKQIDHSKMHDSVAFKYSRFDIVLQNSTIKLDNCIKENPSNEFYNFVYPHCPKGIYGVKKYAKVTIKEVYPGIDWIIYDSQGRGLKYDFDVHPGANPEQIQLLYRTLDQVKLTDEGNIELPLFNGLFSEKAPISYLKESKTNVECNFKIISSKKVFVQNNSFFETRVVFNVKNYDPRQQLVIDPLQLWWGTYFGGNKGSEGVAISTDSTGNVFVLGNTDSHDLPTHPYGTLAYFQGVYGGANNGGGFGDAFLLKFANGGQLLWATYFGGSAIDQAKSMKCDLNGNIFITGLTYSNNFPIKNPGGNAYVDSTNGFTGQSQDIFIAKFSNDGQYRWGTYYGSNDTDVPSALDTDPSGNVYVTGSTNSVAFPTFNPGSGAFFQGNFGGGIPAYNDGFILKFSNNGQRLLATYFGGTGEDSPLSIACDPNGNTYFCGNTSSPNLPVSNFNNGAYYQTINAVAGMNSCGFILRLNSICQKTWCTFLGGCCADRANSIVCDKSGNLFLGGYSGSNNFPLVNPGNGTFFLASNLMASSVICKFNSQCQMVWSTFFGTFAGGGFPKLAIGHCDELYLTLATTPYCTACPPMQLLNPGNGAYYDSTYNNDQTTSPPDIFIAAFTNSGVQRWGTFFGGAGADQSMLISADKFGNVFYTGEQGSLNYYNAADFQSYTSTCIVNPGNNAFHQALPISGTPNFPKRSCVIGKFTGSSLNVNYTTSGCGNTNTANIQVNGGWGPYSYTWSTGSNSNALTNVPAGLYSVLATDKFFGCTTNQNLFLGTTTITVSINSPSSTVCQGNSAILSASGANTFSWSPSNSLTNTTGNSVTATPSISTVYTLVASNGPGCNSDTTISLFVNPLPQINIMGERSICEGSSTKLIATGAISYSWTNGNQIISNSTTISITPNKKEFFTLSGADSNNCINTATFSLEVNPLPDLKLGGSFSVCAGENVTLTASGADSYKWGNITNAIYPSQNEILFPISNSSYTLVGTTDKNCIDSLIFNTHIFALPYLSLIAPDSVCAGIEFPLKADAEGIFSWESVGTINCNDCSNTGAQIDEPGFIYVSVKDQNSCVTRDRAYLNLTDKCDFEIVIPNIFTPNDDDANDIFKIKSNGLNQLSCVIFNRWGTEIASFERVNGFWDGRTTSGLQCSDGVYMYFVHTVDMRNKSRDFKGTVTLIR
jgi:gliding motility-associated-like protein